MICWLSLTAAISAAAKQTDGFRWRWGRGSRRKSWRRKRKESSLIIPFDLTVKVLLMWQSDAAAKQLISTAATEAWACRYGREEGR